jgi:hypothetical protein
LTGLHIKQEDKGTQGKEGCVQKQVKTNPMPIFVEESAESR